MKLFIDSRRVLFQGHELDPEWIYASGLSDAVVPLRWVLFPHKNKQITHISISYDTDGVMLLEVLLHWKRKNKKLQIPEIIIHDANTNEKLNELIGLRQELLE